MNSAGRSRSSYCYFAKFLHSLIPTTLNSGYHRQSDIVVDVFVDKISRSYLTQSPEVLSLSSCMACNMDFLGYGLAPYLEEKLGFETAYVANMPWRERERRFDTGAIQVLWICGKPYVKKARDITSGMRLLAAPVRQGARYQGQAVYFSDIVVHRSSRFRSFEDLKGGSWAYNEPNSHSGHTTILYHLASLNQDGDYFSHVVESGSHERSLRMIRNLQIDGSAIDSTVLEDEIARRPSLADEIRVLGTIGPSPAPPWLIREDLPTELQDKLEDIFWNMHKDPHGKRILDNAKIASLAPVTDSHYDKLREMDEIAGTVEFPGPIEIKT